MLVYQSVLFLPESWFSGKWLYLKDNDPIGDTPIFDWTMTMGERVTKKLVGGFNPTKKQLVKVDDFPR